MKTQINLTTSFLDLERFGSRDDLLDLLEGDGIELMCYEEDVRGIIPKERVTGIDMNCLPYWVDFLHGDLASCVREYDDIETVRSVYGGDTPDALVRHYRKDLMNAEKYGAEYVVFHVCDGSVEETFTGKRRRSDREVIDAAAELLNEVFREIKDGPWLLLENMWYAGHRFTDPDITAYMLESVKYPKTGLMLDTGHLLHTDIEISTQEDGIRYINRMLDIHGSLTDRILGVHLNQSLTGDLMRRTQADPPVLAGTYAERFTRLFEYVFAIDRHEPFTCAGVSELIDRIDPDYLTYELISRDLDEHRALLRAQRSVFGK